MRRFSVFYLLACLIFAACGPVPDDTPTHVQRVALWDHKVEGDRWTQAALTALDAHGAVLLQTVPEDIDDYCPSYADGGPEVRKGFWVVFLSALAKHESTLRPDVSGGDGQWHGLLQIAPATAEGYGCRAQTEDELKRGGLNLACAIRIMAVTVPRDGVISEGMEGVAADWGPFHQSAKREDIQAITRSYAGCQP